MHEWELSFHPQVLEPFSVWEKQRVSLLRLCPSLGWQEPELLQEQFVVLYQPLIMKTLCTTFDESTDKQAVSCLKDQLMRALKKGTDLTVASEFLKVKKSSAGQTKSCSEWVILTLGLRIFYSAILDYTD